MFSKLAQTVPIKLSTAAALAQAFFRHWVFVYGPTIDLLSDNGPKSTSEFHQDICSILDIENRFATTDEQQGYEKGERINRAMLNTLRSYVADHRKVSDMYTDWVTYACNNYVHLVTLLSTFYLVLF